MAAVLFNVLMATDFLKIVFLFIKLPSEKVKILCLFRQPLKTSGRVYIVFMK